MTSPGRYRALSALLLLAPWTPLLFQGQEFGATTPFFYFADVIDELREPVRKGRFDFLKQFPGTESLEVQRKLSVPSDSETFLRSKLDFAEREKFPEMRALYRDLIQLRRQDQIFCRQESGKVDGAVLNDHAFVLRFFGPTSDDRLLLINLGRAFAPRIVPEPLLAAPCGCRWKTLWSTESVTYGGPGDVPVEDSDGWQIPAEAAVALRPVHESVEG